MREKIIKYTPSSALMNSMKKPYDRNIKNKKNRD